jgi:SAM-dependent methyltransferase
VLRPARRSARAVGRWLAGRYRRNGQVAAFVQMEGRMVLTDKSAQYTDADGTIDVKKLIAAYTFEEHAFRADKYFHTITDPWAHHLRKPFSSVQESQAVLAGLSSLLSLLKLQPGHHVVDFGCGTGWLAAALSMLQCQVTAIDISQRALDIAREAFAEHPFLKRQPAAFRRLEEARVPVDSASVDRIICFDCFHHVADQKLYLQEFFRILRPGGMVGFHEPGPGHSRTAGSQYEMRHFAVIENDIVIEEISATARAIGFEDMTMAVFTDTPMTLSPEAFFSLAQSGNQQIYADLGKRLFDQSRSKSVFTLRRPGIELLDSRSASALGAELKIVEQRFSAERRSLALTVQARNTGTGAWLPSGDGVGAVSIGMRISTAGSAALTSEPIRFKLSETPVAPGNVVQVSLLADLGPYPGDLVIDLDLVAELVIWFSQVGFAPPRIVLSTGRR